MKHGENTTAYPALAPVGYNDIAKTFEVSCLDTCSKFWPAKVAVNAS